MIGLADVRAAAELLQGVTDHTPVQLSRALSHVVGTEVWLKCENLQRTGSFKLRGAYVRMARLSAQEQSRGVVAASAGNHAQGVALAARMLGIESVVFMPVDAALPKIAATREYGARVESVGTSVDEALQHAHEYADRTGAVLIHPFDHEDVVAGQGTIALEIAEQVPDVATVLVPIGGGGLAAGVVAALAELRPSVRVVGVQAERAASYPASLAAGHPVPAPELRTMADGIAVGVPGTVPFGILSEHRIPVRTVSEEDLSRALLLVAERAKLLVEPSGAAAVASLMASPGGPARGRSSRSCPAATSTRSSSCAWSGTGSRPRAGSCSCASVSTTPPAPWRSLLHDLAATGANVMHVSHARTGADARVRRGGHRGPGGDQGPGPLPPRASRPSRRPATASPDA